jgi:hypothetical protein
MTVKFSINTMTLELTFLRSSQLITLNNINKLTVQTLGIGKATVLHQLSIEILCSDKDSRNMLHFTEIFCTRYSKNAKAVSDS